MRRVSTDALAAREVWTPEQAARVLGRGASYWRERFDAGDVDGYVEGKRQTRYLFAASARAYLQGRAATRPRQQFGNHTQAALAQFDRG